MRKYLKILKIEYSIVKKYFLLLQGDSLTQS